MSQPNGWNKRWYVLVGLVVLLAVGGVAWIERTPLLSWIYVRGLARADDGSQAVWVERVAGLDGAAIAGLVELLNQDDARVCGNAQAALCALSKRWSADDPRRHEVARQLADGFPRFSEVGQGTALKVATSWLTSPTATQPTTQGTVRACARLLQEAARVRGTKAHAAGLDLAAKLLAYTHDTEIIKPCQDLTLACLQDSEAKNRARAVELALNPNLDLAKPAAALLNDSAPEVRRGAMLAVGVAKDAVMTDDLLPWLHDSDMEVRHLCELELRGRGLQDDQLLLGRLITDPSAKKRLEVLNYLHPSAGGHLDAGVWLRHLSHDSAPEVRFAAIRVIQEDGLDELNDRIDQMARNDPSPTICDFARRCLNSHDKAKPASAP
jgi:hypothetical protein